MEIYKSQQYLDKTISVELITIESIQQINACDIIKGILLGYGMYSRVYKGRWNDQDIVIKEIKEIKGKPKLTRKLFQNEVNILSQCYGSPYIPQLLTTIIDSTNMWIIMELCTGGDLFDYTPLIVHPAEIQALFADTAKGLAWLHNRRIVHRDVKPENILLHQKTNTCRTRALLGDMGMASELSNSGFLYDICGTLIYSAPEMINEEPYNEKVDVYSFGLSAIRVYERRKWVVPKWASDCSSTNPIDRPNLNIFEIQSMCKDGTACKRGRCCWFVHPVLTSTTKSTDIDFSITV